MSPAPLRLALLQFSPALRDPAANARRIVSAAGGDIDLLLTPELALTGYDVGDDAAALAVPASPGSAAPAGLGDRAGMLVGLVERGRSGLPYNAAAHLAAGRVQFRHRKVYLPTYGMFDEARYFARGRSVSAFEVAEGWRAGVLICEDFWHPGLAYALAAQEIDVLFVLAAAPRRGVWEGGEGAARFASWPAWERIARATAQVYGIYVALANRTGVEGGVTFAGGSFIVGPDGEVAARAGAAEEVVLRVDLSAAEVARARRPGAHVRDDDPDLVCRHLERVREATSAR